jgi:phage terminase large subunit
MPRKWQQEFHKNMEQKKRAILVLHRRAGKAQPLSAKVLTPTGFITMGEVKVGQEVLTPKGTTTKVIGVFPQPKQQIYKITLQDGSETRATAEHLWKISFANRRRKDGVYNTLYLKEFLEKESKKTLKNKSRPLIDSISPQLNFGKNKNLLLNPYLLGLLIGDGTYSCESVRFSTADKEIVDWLTKNYKLGFHKNFDYTMPGIISIIKKLGLQGQKSNNKTIPKQYLEADREVRLSLLKGLMDTDGYQDKRKNSAEYCSISKELVNQVAYLCRSLGMNATVSSPQKTTFTYKGEKKQGQMKYRVHIRPNQTIFNLKRKQNIQKDYRFENRKAIVKIEEDGFEVAQCIMIDDIDHLYITDDFIVTHNTTAIVNQLQKDAMLVPNSQYAYICPFKDQAKRVAWDLFKKYAETIPGVRFAVNDLTIFYPTGSKILLLGSDNAHSLRGIGLWGVALDEFAQQPAHLWGEIILPTLADHKGYAIFLGTPQGKGEFYRLYKRGLEDPKWYAKVLGVQNTGVFTEEEIEELKKECSDDEFNQEWMCSFESSIQGAYYSNEINEARRTERIGNFPYDKALPVYTAWDIGRSDYTSIGFFQQAHGNFKMIDFYENSEYDITHYIQVLKDKPYCYGKHFGPTDIKNQYFNSNLSPFQVALQHGIKFEVLERNKTSFMDQINSARIFWGKVFINVPQCELFLDQISLYRKKFDKDKGIWLDKEVEDYTNHCADMFRYAAIASDKMNNDDELIWRQFTKNQKPVKSILQK